MAGSAGWPQQTWGPLARQQAHRVGLGPVAVPKAPLVPLAETVHERASVEIFRAVPWLSILPGWHDHPTSSGALGHHCR